MPKSEQPTPKQPTPDQRSSKQPASKQSSSQQASPNRAAQRAPSRRPPAPSRSRDQDDMPEDMDAFRFAMARRIATFLENHKACALAACQRARRCVGTPITCVKPAGPVDPEEAARVKAEIYKALSADLARHDAAERAGSGES